MIDATKGFTLVREFAATPAEIWDAWTNPDEAAHWWHPRGVSTPRESVSIDARVGGTYAYTMINDATGERYPTVGEYREVVPFERLVFTWGRAGDDPDDRPLITVSIEPLQSDLGGERTRMTFDLRGYDAAPGDADVYDGWDSAFEVLSDHLTSAETI
jgi:uncharacterized protein YndB with AHSA1/START domain